MGNTIGERIRVTVFGQSHAPAIGCVIEGLPCGMALDMGQIQAMMDRRAPGGSDTSTARREADVPRVIAGLNERGETCGAPLCAVIDNADTRSADYEALRDVPRPGHADFAAHLRFGDARDVRGGGPFSGRLTAPLCFAGAVCQQLPQLSGVRVGAHLLSVADVSDAAFDPMGMDEDTLSALKEKQLAVLDDAAGDRMREAILAAKLDGDSVGGVIEVIAQGVPGGLGEPMFGGVEPRLAQALMAIPGARGVEFGMGFAAARSRGSAHNDALLPGGMTETNRHGGALGGITTGMPILARVAIKPTPSIGQMQKSVSLRTGEAAALQVKGRHDPCIAPRAVPVAEALVWLVLADLAMGA